MRSKAREVREACDSINPCAAWHRVLRWVLGPAGRLGLGSWGQPEGWVLGLGSWGRRRPDFGVKNKGKNVSLLKKSTWNEAKLQFSFIFAPKNTGRTPSPLWYFGQRCWILFDLTIFFGYNTKLPLHMGRAERAAIFLTVTDWVLGLGPPADAGSWVLGLQGTLGLGSWGQGPRPMSGGD